MADGRNEFGKSPNLRVTRETFAASKKVMSLFTFIGQALMGWLLADLFSGWVHWLEDRVLRIDMPILGPAIVLPNRVHHTQPLKFTYSPFLRRNMWLWIAVTMISVAMWFIGLPFTLWAAMTIGGLVVNEVHRFAHRPGLTGPLLKTLQKIGVFQSPRHHAGHHRMPTDTRYCTLTDWLNPILDRLNVWNGLERILSWIHLEPNRGTA